MRARVRDLVVFDDDEAGEEREHGGAVEDGVDVCAGAFLGGGVGRLQDQDRLGCEEDAGAVEEGVGGEEDEGVDEDGGPDCGCELGGRLVSGFDGDRGRRTGEDGGGGRTIQMPAWAMIAVPVVPVVSHECQLSTSGDWAGKIPRTKFHPIGFPSC